MLRLDWVVHGVYLCFNVPQTHTCTLPKCVYHTVDCTVSLSCCYRCLDTLTCSVSETADTEVSFVFATHTASQHIQPIHGPWQPPCQDDLNCMTPNNEGFHFVCFCLTGQTWFPPSFTNSSFFFKMVEIAVGQVTNSACAYIYTASWITVSMPTFTQSSLN